MSTKKVRSESPTKHRQKQVQTPEKKLKKVNKFYLGSRERYIVFSCDFDSGNIECVKQLSQFQYRLGCVPDNYGTPHEHNSKGWFYFSVTGFPKDTKGRFYIERVQALYSLLQSKHNSYRPVYRIGQDGEWLRLPTEATLFLRQNDMVELFFEYLFRKETDVIYFAFCYPFTYGNNLKVLQGLGDFFYIDEFYYHQQVLTFSPEGRPIHLLTITSYDQKDTDTTHEIIFDPKLFPENNRPSRFRKPVILITARVHPAQTPSSFAMQGVLKFLTNKKDLRAYLLRQMFVFMVVPMINVDGVFKGHFRMDVFGNNLNRHYISPTFEEQPAIYGIKALATHLEQQKRLTFYFDLHAHNAKKGCFFYGNAINDFVDQVESQVFCKLFSMNCKNFEYQSCNFSTKHMKAKDRFEDLTKEGCGRVVMHRLTGIIHSYSLQCGIISSNTLNSLPQPANIDFKVGQLGFEPQKAQDNADPIYSGADPPLYTPYLYQNVGKGLLISILDTFDKNPYSRVYNSELKSMQMLRRIIAFDVFHNADRFRMFQRFTFHKVKNINELMKQNFRVKFDYNRIFNLNEAPLLKTVQWPPNIPGLARQQMSRKSPGKIKRNHNLYTGNSDEDNQHDFLHDLIAQIKQNQSTTIPSPQKQLNEDRKQAQTSQCLQRCEQTEDVKDEPLDSQHDNFRCQIVFTGQKVIHSRESRKNLNMITSKQSGLVNIVVPEQNRRKSFHHTKRDLRIEIQKRNMSRKQFQKFRQQQQRIDKLVTHQNNFKLNLFEQTLKDPPFSLLKNMNSNLQFNTAERSSEYRHRSNSISKPKKMDILTVKMRELKKQHSQVQDSTEQQIRFPDINTQRLYPYATAAPFLQPISATTQLEVIDLLSNNIKFQAIKIKQQLKNIQRQRT